MKCQMSIWFMLWAMWWAVSLAVKRNTHLKNAPPLEKMHQYWWLTRSTLSPILDDGQQIPNPEINSPDFRVEEPPWTAYHHGKRERNRPYRLSPHSYMTSSLPGADQAGNMGCTCCTVYKRLTPLSTCAVITTRHILTTASSVELVLRGHRRLRTLENILGVWYDHNIRSHNSSFYISISRIHYHPQFLRPENVNRSHPLPVIFDLAVMATSHTVYGWYMWRTSSNVCPRAASNWWEKATPAPVRTDSHKNVLYAVGFQFIWSLNRFPTPFHKYFVRSDEYGPCPKKEWGWHVCVDGFKWAKYGMDSGSTLFRTNDGSDWRYNGLLGMLSISMRLRDAELSLYYLILDCHVVLDFLYAAFMGRLPYEYLDYRFEDTQWAAPIAHPWAWIQQNFDIGESHAFDYYWW